MKAVVIKGDFTDEEFAEVVATIRRLDTRRPDATFEIMAVDPSRSSMELAENTLREALPRDAGRPCSDFVAYERVTTH